MYLHLVLPHYLIFRMQTNASIVRDLAASVGRVARFLGEITGNDPKNTVVPVIGGHSGVTIVPLLSQNAYGKGVSGDNYAKLVYRIQYGGDEVVKAKDGAGSATLSM